MSVDLERVRKLVQETEQRARVTDRVAANELVGTARVHIAHADNARSPAIRDAYVTDSLVRLRAAEGAIEDADVLDPLRDALTLLEAFDADETAVVVGSAEVVPAGGARDV